MRYQNLVATTFVGVLAIGMATLSPGSYRSVNAELAPVRLLSQTASRSMILAQAMTEAPALASGSFVNSEHPTQGMVAIINKGGQKYLKFDRSFKSDSGPDLFVLLHRQDAPKQYQKSDYLSLGRLQKVAGTQMYKIPAGVDVKQFKSVVIWCRKFNATFGFAPLN